MTAKCKKCIYIKACDLNIRSKKLFKWRLSLEDLYSLSVTISNPHRIFQLWVKTLITLFPQSEWVMHISLWERGRLSLQLPSHKNIFTGVRQQQPWWATSNRAVQKPHRLSTSEPHLDFSFDPLSRRPPHRVREHCYTVLGTFRASSSVMCWQTIFQCSIFLFFLLKSYFFLEMIQMMYCFLSVNQ